MPVYEIMYPLGNPLDIARRPIFATKNYRNLSPKRGWATGAPLGPLTTDFNLVGAKRVDAQDFRTLDGNFAAERPFDESELYGAGIAPQLSPRRRGMAPGSGAGGIRLGRIAPIDLPVDFHPSGGRKGGLSRGRGRPPSQSPSGLPAQRGDRYLVGLFGHGLPVDGHFVWTARRQLAYPCPNCRHVRAGYCPRCTHPTHIAAPARYAVGEFSPE